MGRNVCRNGGVCKNPTLSFGFECDCKEGFYGEKCQFEVQKTTEAVYDYELIDETTTVIPVVAGETEESIAVIDDAGSIEELFNSNSTPSGPLLVDDDCETPNLNELNKSTTVSTTEKLDSARLLSDKNRKLVNKAQNALGFVAKAVEK